MASADVETKSVKSDGKRSVSDLMNMACQKGMVGMSYCLQYNPRVVVVANRCFRVQCRARADGQDSFVFSAFVSDPKALPRTCWKYMELDGKQMVVDEYTGRMLTGLGIQAWVPAGMEDEDSICGVLAAFIHPEGGEFSDEETRAAAQRMSEIAAAVYAEVSGSAAPPDTALPVMAATPALPPPSSPPAVD